MLWRLIEYYYYSKVLGEVLAADDCVASWAHLDRPQCVEGSTHKLIRTYVHTLFWDINTTATSIYCIAGIFWGGKIFVTSEFLASSWKNFRGHGILNHTLVLCGTISWVKSLWFAS